MSYYHTGLKLGFCGECKIKIQPRVGKLNMTVIVDTYIHICLAQKSECNGEKQKTKEIEKKWIHYCPGKKVYLGNRVYDNLSKPPTI